MPEIKLQFYRTSRNTRKLKQITQDFSIKHLPKEIDDACYVTVDSQSDIEEFKLLAYFWGIIKKYKDAVMFTNDQMLTREQSEGVINWIRCYCNHEYFPDQQDYCCISPGLKHLHGWGCKWLHSIIRHGTFGKHCGIQWYKIGPFDGQVQFIDKQDIKDKLAAEADSKCLQLCPLFSLEKAFRYVDQLPGQIDPSIDVEWEYDLSEEPESKFEIIGVRPKKDLIICL